MKNTKRETIIDIPTELQRRVKANSRNNRRREEKKAALVRVTAGDATAPATDSKSGKHGRLQ